MNEFEKNRIEQAIRHKRMRIISVAAGVLFLAAGMVALGIWLSRSQRSSIPASVLTYDDVGREHISLGAPLPKPYNSNPPSSGGHFQSPANWGIYDYEVHDQIFIHNLEHGGIWVAYRPGIPQGVVRELKKIVDEFSGSKIVMAPRSTNDADIAAVAWGRVMKFDLGFPDDGSERPAQPGLTEKQKEDIRAFYKSFKNKGPEFVPDGMPGIDPKSVQ